MAAFSYLCVAFCLVAPVVRAELSQGEACTTVGTRGSPAVACKDGLMCNITDPGKPEVDIPNAGTCQPCVCGALCFMVGGGSGACFEDGTCAVSIMAPQCPLRVGDVCHSGGVETGPGVDRRNDCPKGSSCRSNGQMAIGGEVTSTCQVDTPLEVGDVCRSGGVETGPGVDRENDCPPGSICAPRSDEFAIGGEVAHTCQAAPGDETSAASAWSRGWFSMASIALLAQRSIPVLAA